MFNNIQIWIILQATHFWKEYKLYTRLQYHQNYFIFLKFFTSLNNLYTPCGVPTHNPEVKRHMLLGLSQPGAPKLFNFLKLKYLFHAVTLLWFFMTKYLKFNRCTVKACEF